MNTDAELQVIHIDRLKPGTTVLVETEDHIWELEVIEPESLLVTLVGTDHRFRHRRPVQGYFVGSSIGPKGTILGVIVKGWVFEVRFADADLISGFVKSARVSGDGWHYDAIS